MISMKKRGTKSNPLMNEGAGGAEVPQALFYLIGNSSGFPMRQKALRAGCALARTEDTAARSCSAHKAVKPLKSEGQGS